MKYPSGECKCCDKLADENAALKADNELLRSLSFRDERDALKDQVNTLEDKAIILRATIKAQEHWKGQATQQAAVIEQMRVALSYYATGVWESMTYSYFDMNPYDRATFVYEQPKREPATQCLALQPSPEILEARDQRVAEACAKLTAYLPVGCGLEGRTIAEAIRSGEWKKYL